MCPGAFAVDVVADSEAGWALHETSLKPYPACRHVHPAIDAALIAVQQDGLAIGGSILVETYKDALVFCDRADPKTPFESKFSLQHAIAVSLLKGTPTLSDFSEESLHGPQIMRIRKAVKVHETDEFNSVYPAHYGAAVTVGGRRFKVEDAYGDPEYPMNIDAILKKAKMLMQYGGLTADRAANVCQTILSFQSGGSLSDYAGVLKDRA